MLSPEEFIPLGRGYLDTWELFDRVSDYLSVEGFVEVVGGVREPVYGSLGMSADPEDYLRDIFSFSVSTVIDGFFSKVPEVYIP